MSRDRTKQINLDLTKHSKAKEIYDNLPGNKTAWVAGAIEEKHNKEKGTVFTLEQEQKIEEIVNKAIRKIIPKEYHKHI